MAHAVWTIFAIIKDNVVRNVIVGDYHESNVAAMLAYGNDAFAIEVTQIPVQIADKFENGNFYRYNSEIHEWEMIEFIPTVEEDIDNLQSTTNGIRQDITDVEIGMAQIFEMIVGN